MSALALQNCTQNSRLIDAISKGVISVNEAAILLTQDPSQLAIYVWLYL